MIQLYGNDLFYSTGNYAEENDLVNMGSGRPSDFEIEMCLETILLSNISL